MELLNFNVSWAHWGLHVEERKYEYQSTYHCKMNGLDCFLSRNDLHLVRPAKAGTQRTVINIDMLACKCWKTTEYSRK